jgi:hypothetical protein
MPSAYEMDQSGGGSTEKGFYISFDSDMAPKRPKPPLRVKRSSPKKVCVNNLGRITVQRPCNLINTGLKFSHKYTFLAEGSLSCH